MSDQADDECELGYFLRRIVVAGIIVWWALVCTEWRLWL